MAEVVELFGAPGTGKSSLLRALDGRRVGGRRIVSAQRLLRVRRSGPLGMLRPRDATPAERRAALAERREDWADLLELIAAAPLGRDPSSHGAGGEEHRADPLRALHAPGWLAASLELRALAVSAPDALVVLLDEGLVQRTGIVLGPDPDPSHLDRYVRALPPALLHLHLHAGPTTVMARLGARARVIDRHAGLDGDGLVASVTADLDLYERTARALASAGQPVVGLGTDDAERQVADEAHRRIVAALR
jgi:hypothetical protein